MELGLCKNPFVLAYYSKLTHDYDSGKLQSPEIILPSVPVVTKDLPNPPSPQEYLLPSVILWDPLQQLDCFKEGICCPFDCHNGEDDTPLLKPKKNKKGFYCWQAGQRLAVAPRQLCSSSWPVILLSRIYFCTGRIKHRSYIAHDPEILSMIPPSEATGIPFVLLHRTGFTKELSDTVLSLLASGGSLENIEHTITQQHISNFAQCKAKYEEDIQLLSLGTNQEPADFPEYKPTGVPSMEMLLGCLLVNHKEKARYYTQRMSELSAQVLLLGHFFKASQQMGYFCPNTNKWVPKYDYIFAILNEKGQVLSWQATKGKDPHDVLPLVRAVYQRLNTQGVTIELILSPDCCSFREPLISIFGSDIQVKMDPAFAVRKLEKRFKIRKCDQEAMKSCLENLSLVFQQGPDVGLCRMQETPVSDVIHSNLMSFVSHWKTMKGESGERLLHEPALQELEALQTDIKRGCLSGVPPSCGSEHVAELREQLRPALHRRFLNTDLTIPAVTSLFYIWNEHHSGSQGPLMLIDSYKDALDCIGFVPTTEQFGLVRDKGGDDENDEEPFQYTLDIHSVQCLILAALGLTGEDSECADSSTLSEATLRKISHIARNYHFVGKLLCNISVQVPDTQRLLHLSTCSLLLFSRSDCNVQDTIAHKSRLKEEVSKHLGTIYGEAGDPEGFFIALANNLNSILADLQQCEATECQQFKEYLQSVGYDPAMLDDEQVNVVTLRRLISKEWLENRERYSPLLMTPLLEFEKEAVNFANEGYIKADMMNLLPLAATQIFKLPIILFTSLELCPVVTVVPADKLSTQKCIFMGYSAAEYGTYYTVKVISQIPTHPDKPKHVCRCGLGNAKNKDSGRQFCIHIPGKYLTRCECFRNGVGCGYLCRCANCGNPQGTSVESRAKYVQHNTRSRPKHKFQTSRGMDKTPEMANWNTKEQLAFELLTSAMHYPHQGIWVLEATPNSTLKYFNQLVTIDTQSSNSTLLSTKSLAEVKQMLRVYLEHMENYADMYKKQSEINWMQMSAITNDLTNPEVNQVLVIVESTE
ncbi:predicted protein [Nematostella vectensis]|uniref:Uncharacterized protein n=1 Tax=Nematostella vectensis TaxID=45351 RepID=A7S9E4_NEMVE|nr:predicted protein [Nematostella vectensis]|eukprot:XP_001631754.1 predicted protein [Nematostella vectensis]